MQRSATGGHIQTPWRDKVRSDRCLEVFSDQNAESRIDLSPADMAPFAWVMAHEASHWYHRHLGPPGWDIDAEEAEANELASNCGFRFQPDFLPRQITMRVWIAVLMLCITPTFLVAQDGDRIDALVVALEWSLQQWAGPDPEQRQRLVLDMRRTAVGEHRREKVVEQVAARIGAALGVIESYCTALPREVGQLRQTEVREGWGIVAANVQEWSHDAAIVRVIVWRGSGHHTGGSVDLLLERTNGGWEVAKHLTTSTGACIPGN